MIEYEGNGYIVLKDVTGVAPTGDTADANYSPIVRRGTTFIPAVDETGEITWTNDGVLDNPAARNIRGPQGAKGDPGKNFTIKGVYTTFSALQAAVTSPEQSDFYAVGGEEIYDVYMWNEDAWLNLGSIQGPAGPAFIPSIDDAGNLSWSSIDGYATPETKNIKGPDGDVWKPAVAEDGTLRWEKDNTETAPASVNIKGARGVAGPAFIPTLADDGTLSWTPIDGYETPASKNIMGPNLITTDTSTNFQNTSGTQLSGILRASNGKVSLAAANTDYATPPIVTSISLPVANWTTSQTQVVSSGLSMVTADNTVIAEPAPASIPVWRECGVYCSAQAAGNLTFAYIDGKPEEAITVNIMIIGTVTA